MKVSLTSFSSPVAVSAFLCFVLQNIGGYVFNVENKDWKDESKV
jgi:hypothetical protein